MSLVWRDQLSVGNEAIDNDHKHLLALINLLETALKSPDKRPELVEIMKELQSYTQTHFTREEQLMKEMQYARYGAHKQAHTKLVDHLQEVADKLVAGTDEILTQMAADDLAQLMRTWLIDHIIKEDLLLKPYLKEYR